MKITVLGQLYYKGAQGTDYIHLQLFTSIVCYYH